MLRKVIIVETKFNKPAKIKKSKLKTGLKFGEGLKEIREYSQKAKGNNCKTKKVNRLIKKIGYYPQRYNKSVNL